MKDLTLAEFIPTLATQFEVLLDQLDSADLKNLTDFDISAIRFLSCQARGTLDVAKEELDAVENQFTQMVSENLEDLFSCVYENPSDHTEEIQQESSDSKMVQLTIEPPDLSFEESLRFRTAEVQINEMDNTTQLKVVALNLLEALKDAAKLDKLYRRMIADLTFPDIAKSIYGD